MLTVLYTTLLQSAEGLPGPSAGQVIFIIGMTLLGVAVIAGLAALFMPGITSGVRTVTGLLRRALSGLWARIKQLVKSRPFAGMSYDPKQDIFYFNVNAWQRNFGYCRLYDEAAAALGMIIDCEPIYFDYGGKKWLIEFWKGQYSIATGCEIGVYNTTAPEFNIPGLFNGTFYEAASSADMLPIFCTLYRNGSVLFRRQGRHWWLAGFKLGEYAEPSELVAYISIVMKDRSMLDAFLAAMRTTGYTDKELMVNGNTVNFVYSVPHSVQPFTRRKAEESLNQDNKYLVDRFNELAGEERGALSKLETVKKLDPALYGSVREIGKPFMLYEKYNALRQYVK